MNAVGSNNISISNADLCVVDGSCKDAECGCTTTKPPNAPDDTTRRKTLSRTGILGLLCVLGCAAGPLAIGGVAAAAGALSGEAWVIAAGLMIATVVYAYRRSGRRGC